MSEVKLKFLRFHCLDRYHCAVQYHQLVDGIIQRFEASNPSVKIDSSIMRNWYQLMYTLHRDLHKDDCPDVFHTCGGGELEDLVKQGLVYDLTRDLDCGWRDHFARAAWHPLRFNGKEYAVPLEQGFIFVWYNKEIFSKHELSPPGSFEDLLQICRKLRSHGITPFSAGNKERWPGAFFFSHLFHRIGGENVFVPNFTIDGNYPEIRRSFIAAGEKLVALSEAGAFHEDCETTNYQDMRLMFGRGEAAMQLNGNRLLGYLKDESPGILEHLGVFPFPLVRGGRGTLSTIFGGSMATYAISAKSRNKKAAIAFLRTMTDLQAARDVIEKMGDVPAMTHVPCEEYPSSLHGDLARLLARAEKLQVHFFKYLAPHPAGVYLNAVAALLRREISPEEAFGRLEQALVRASAGNQFMKLAEGQYR
jgi:raffinose/stachyose/melibiose transport system substrate-binding protein